MRKRIIGLLMAFTLANSMILLAGCGSDSGKSSKGESNVAEESAEDGASTDADHYARIQESGKIIIAMEGQWAPWTYHDDSGDLVGFDTEVGRAIAEKLGVEAEFVEGEWDGLFTGLDAGKFDVIINGVEITDERSEKYDFTTPYAYIKTGLVVSQDNTEITGFEDLNGKTTSNSLGSTYADMAEQYGATVQNVDTLSETIDMVTSGRVDATLNAEVSFYDYLSQKPDAPIKIVALTDEASKVSIPLVKGSDNESLNKAISEAIDELSADGTLAELSIKYFGSDITKK